MTVAGRTIEKQRQNILMFQQKNSGKGKIQGILKHGDDLFDLEIISINDALPDIVDDTTMYIPQDFKTDMVLDFLTHPDLSHDLGVICADRGIPMVASGKKLRIGNVFTPPTWCGLSRQVCLGKYGERFGAPEFDVEVSGGLLRGLSVIRGAPCGATWPAAERITGLPVEEAIVRIGLDIQFFCTADPAGWDPIYGKSPVHFAGRIHSEMLNKAIKKR